MACRAFFCDHSPDCPDFACEGHPVVVLPRAPGLHTEEGGRAVSGGFGVSLSMPIAEVPEPIPDATATDRTDWIGHILLWIFGALAFVLTAAAVFGVQLP